MNQLLSQDEVDALLRGISDGDIEMGQDDGTGVDGVRPYDFANQDRITRGRMPTLEIIDQKLARLLRASLSGALRRIVDVTAGNIEMIKFGELLKTMPMPTSMHIFRMSPLRGGALLVIESNLVSILIESFFGGPGGMSVKIKGRDFTPIESGMILRVVNIIFEDMEKAWEAVEPIKIDLERSEVNPRFVGIVPPSDVVVVSSFEIDVDEAKGIAIICIPYSMLEPFRSKLYAAFQNESSERDYTWLRRMARQIEDVEVEASVELGSTEISMRSLLELRVGDIICLDQDCDSELVIRIEGVPKFMGLPQVIKQRKALEITSQILPPEEEEDNE